MEYITVREAAEKWNISERLVQKYCVQERIRGAKKLGRSWVIPVNAIKPRDARRPEDLASSHRVKRHALQSKGLMPLMNTAFEPGHCKEHIMYMADGPEKSIAAAEYYYFSGQPEKAVKSSEALLGSADWDIRLSAHLIYTYANLSVGNIFDAKRSLSELRSMLENTAEQNPEMRAALSFIMAAAAVLLHLPVPEEMPSLKEHLYFLPTGLRMFALYVSAHYSYLQKEYEKSLGIVEATLAMQHEIYPIPTIYLHLVAVMNYMSLKDKEKATEHLMAAWRIAQPDDLIEGFGEHHGLLGGMLEAVIKPEYPEDFKRIIAITYRFSAGWRKVHNPYTGHDVADNLTTTEFAIAMLAARGWTNKEISTHLEISLNTVKSHIASAFQKLGITQRSELKQFMLK